MVINIFIQLICYVKKIKNKVPINVIMMRIIKINEQQYRRLMLDEEMHYPKFLDILKNEISTKVHIEMEKQLSINKTDFEFSLPLKCEYTDNIIFKMGTIYLLSPKVATSNL